MADRTLLDRAGVARRLGISVESLYRKLPELYAQGFPKQALGRMSGARWDPAAIDRWLDAKITAGASSNNAKPNQTESDPWADRLDNRVPLVAGNL